MLTDAPSSAERTRLLPGATHPTFFIVGAPKSGTSALDQYLRDHPDAFLCRKEPHYFASDFLDRGVDTPDGYADLYTGCPAGARAVGESSVWYLYSRDAVPNILHHLPEARIIAMLRNPVDLVHSKHAQMVYNCEEDVPDFEAAWRLEGERKQGRRLPPEVPNPSFLYYSELGRLGEQVERLVQTVPAGQLKLIVFEDFCADTGEVYRETLDFLGLPQDGRVDFPRINPNTVHRNAAVGRLLHKPPGLLYRAVKGIERGLGLRQLPGIDLVRRWNTQARKRPSLSADFRAEVVAHYRPEVERLEAIIGRDLSAWKQP